MHCLPCTLHSCTVYHTIYSDGYSCPSRGAELKGLALKALARALAPSAEAHQEPIPEETKSVVAPFVKVCVGSMDRERLRLLPVKLLSFLGCRS